MQTKGVRGGAAIVIAIGAAGCATSSVRAVVAEAPARGMRVSARRVVDGNVNPLAPVRVAVEGDAVTVRFTRPHADGAVVTLDAVSLSPLRPEVSAPAESAVRAGDGVVRARLPTGGALVCWKSGDAESGYQLLVRAEDANGAPHGGGIAISEAGGDLMGTPSLVALPGARAVAAFATTAGGRVELVAVEVEML